MNTVSIYTVTGRCAILLLAVLALAAMRVDAGVGNDEYRLTDHYLVVMEVDAQKFNERMRELGCTVDEAWPAIGVARISGVSDDMLHVLRGDDCVSEVVRDISVNWVQAVSRELNVPVQASAASKDALAGTQAEFYDIQWGLRQIGAAEAWKVSTGDGSVRIGVLDTGISPDHVDLRNKYDLSASVNLSSSNPGNRTDYTDRHYHGTHVSALISSNNVGVAGMAPGVTLVGVKVLDDEGCASFSNLIAGIMYAVDVAKVDVINLSAGGHLGLDGIAQIAEMLHRAIDYAEERGVVVIASAGNASTDLESAELQSFVIADETGTMLVSASKPIDRFGVEGLACYSNYGNGLVSVAAPGGSINCDAASYAGMDDMVISALAPAVARRMGLPNPEGWYMFSTGTSMAAPLVSGLAGLLKSRHPESSAAAICDQIRYTSDDLGDCGTDAGFGHGRINAAKALR